MKNLTARESEVLKFIESYYMEQGHSPSFQDIMVHFGFKSLNSVTDYLTRLSKKGYIEYIRKQSRGIIPKRIPTMPHIPLLYEIPAGNLQVLQSLISDIQEQFDWEAMGLDNSDGQMFALRVKGSSMINRGIRDGDIVIVRMQPTVTERDVAVVRVNDTVTLKRVERTPDNIRLIPENDLMEPIEIDSANDVQIIGKVVRLFRRDI